MKSYLIKDTTREEREQIVAEALGNMARTDAIIKIELNSYF